MEISVTKSCIYKDGRCHCVFSDSSSIILHKGGEYLSYFSPNAELARQVSQCVVGGLRSKLNKLIKLYNHSSRYPILLFAEEIYKVSTKEAKIISSAFLMPGIISVLMGSQEVSSLRFNESSEKIEIVEQDKKGALKYKSIDGEVIVALNSNRTLIKVSFPMLLPHKKPSWTENQSSRIRLTYEYIRISQVFHISACPSEWQPILNVLLRASGEEILINSEEEIIINLPTGTKSEIWSNDLVSPAVNIFSYLNDSIFTYWEPEGTYYITSQTTATILIHEDQSLLNCSNDFISHLREDNCNKFTTQTVPVSVRNANYKLHNFVKNWVEILKLNLSVRPEKSAEEVNEDELLDGIKVENEVEGLGSFIAYNDKSIRVLFEDRTLIRIYSDFTVSAISRSGEAAKFSLEKPYGFEQYIPVCVEFYNWAFLSQTEKARRANEAIERETIVSAEVSRAERLTRTTPPSAPVVVQDETVSQSLIQAKRQLEETKELLSRLSRKC